MWQQTQPLGLLTTSSQTQLIHELLLLIVWGSPALCVELGQVNIANMGRDANPSMSNAGPEAMAWLVHSRSTDLCPAKGQRHHPRTSGTRKGSGTSSKDIIQGLHASLHLSVSCILGVIPMPPNTRRYGAGITPGSLRGAGSLALLLSLAQPAEHSPCSSLPLGHPVVEQ